MRLNTPPKGPRRFGVHESTGGRLQVSTRRYQKFHGELVYLSEYLNSRLLPTEPEEVLIAGVISNIQNLLEHEAEALIRVYVNKQGSKKELAFLSSIETGYVAFKPKYDWLLARKLIDQNDWEILEEVRVLRNGFAHVRPLERRERFKYRGFQLLTQRSVRRLFFDSELVLRRLRKQSGNTSDWMTIPWGYAAEMGWPKEYIEVLEPPKKSK